MASNYQRRYKKTRALKKLKKYKRKDERSISFRKYRICLAIFCILIGWLWSFADSRGASAMGQIMMLIAGTYAIIDIRYIYSRDPIEEIIDDFERQFWDTDFRKDTDSI